MVFKRNLLSLLLVCAFIPIAHAEVTGNIGFTSEYYYRGIFQKTSSASAGIDFEEGNLSGGVWTADVGDGLEYDLYSHYGMSFDSGLSASIGFTGYFYTGEFDDTYKELNLNFDYKWLSFEYSTGTWDGGTPLNDDYSFFAVTLSNDGYYGKYGQFGDEADGDYVELGFETSVNAFDLTLALIINSEELSDQLNSSGQPTSGQALTLTISKSFEL